MINNGKVARVIFELAKGTSLAEVSRIVGISYSSVKNLNKKYSQEILNIENQIMKEMITQAGANNAKYLKTLCDIRDKMQDQLLRRDFSDMKSVTLMKEFSKLTDMIRNMSRSLLANQNHKSEELNDVYDTYGEEFGDCVPGANKAVISILPGIEDEGLTSGNQPTDQNTDSYDNKETFISPPADDTPSENQKPEIGFPAENVLKFPGKPDTTPAIHQTETKELNKTTDESGTSPGHKEISIETGQTMPLDGKSRIEPGQEKDSTQQKTEALRVDSEAPDSPEENPPGRKRGRPKKNTVKPEDKIAG